MKDIVIIPLPNNIHMAEKIRETFPCELGEVEIHPFADGETYVRIGTVVRDRLVILLCTLNQPNKKFLPLMFTAATARDLGARQVGLICPYLAYMRQDRRFHSGEGVTSKYFAKWISREIDWLVTVDPHLHRWKSLSEIYSIPTYIVQAAPLVASWIKNKITRPLIIGPDIESEQWVAKVAQEISAPYVILSKIRRNDRSVEVSIPDIAKWKDHQPVLVDDIVATAGTMVETVKHLQQHGHRAPVCIAVHGVFAPGAYNALHNLGAQIITTNTITHSAEIDISPLIGQVLSGIQK